MQSLYYSAIQPTILLAVVGGLDSLLRLHPVTVCSTYQ